MAKSTAPILLIGGTTIFMRTVVFNAEMDRQWGVVAATGLAAAAFALMEKANQPLAVGVAWVAFVTLLFTDRTYHTSSGSRLTQTSVVGALSNFWNEGK
jgi:hypothetical protein